ncbi:hypothetical protein ACQY0O_005721 [Thecaphora frezii]
MNVRTASLRLLRQQPALAYLGSSAPRPFSSAAQRLTASVEKESTLLTTIKTGLKNAMRSKDTNTSTVLRSLLSDHQYSSLSSSPQPLSSVLQKAIARRLEAAQQFRSASRTDLAENEEAEAAVLQNFLPAQLSPEQLHKLAKDALEELRQKGEIKDPKKALGALIKQMNKQVDPASTTGKAMSEACKKVLEGL